MLHAALGQEPACRLSWWVPLLYELSWAASGLQLDCLLYNAPKKKQIRHSLPWYYYFLMFVKQLINHLNLS